MRSCLSAGTEAFVKSLGKTSTYNQREIPYLRTKALQEDMKKQKLRITTSYVHERLFNADICLIQSRWCDLLEGAEKMILGDRLDYFKEQVERHGEQKTTLATQFPMEGGGSIIWANPEATIGCLVHEATHAAHHLLKCRSVPLSEDTEEVYGYLVEFIFTNLIQQSSEMGKTRKARS